MIWIFMNLFFCFFLSSQFFFLFDKYLTVSWYFSMLTGSFVGSTSNQSTGYRVLELARLKVPVVVFSPVHSVSL